MTAEIGNSQAETSAIVPFDVGPLYVVYRTSIAINFVGTPRTPRVGGGNTEWRPGGTIRRSVPLPPEIGPQWEAHDITMDEATLASYGADRRVYTCTATDEEMIVHDEPVRAEDLLDFMSWPSSPVVSRRLKELLESLFPGGSYFVETQLRTYTYDKIDRPSYLWIPRKTFMYESRKAPRNAILPGQEPSIPREKPPFKSHVFNDYVYWEFRHRPLIREMLQNPELPFWAYGVSFETPVFNAPTYAALRNAGITGLIESTDKEAKDPKRFVNVGRIQ
jgi:hypothetical protein